MKKTITFLAILLISSMAFAQQGFNYKALITESGTALQNHAISVQFSLIDDTSTLVYKENHDTTSDSNGIILLNIGEGGSTFGDFTTIDWSQELFLKVDIDTGSGYTDFGTTAFKTVPYAKYAENGGGAKKLDDLDDVRNNQISIFIGDGAGAVDGGSNFNVSLGARTLHNNIIGDYNTAIGYEALFLNTSATDNTAIGMSSLYSNTTGTRNVALGMTALFSNIAGYNNVSIGYSAGHNSLGNGNIFLGNRAGYFETGDNKLYIENSNSETPLIGGDFSTDEVTINGSIAIKDGTQGANKILTSDINGKASWQVPAVSASQINDLTDAVNDGTSIYLGTGAGAIDDGGNNNIGLGINALYNNSSGDANTANGKSALYSNTTGSDNTANGLNALYYNTTGSHNTAFGRSALAANDIGINNTALGNQAGYNSTGNSNVFIGNQAGYNETGDDMLYIENTNSSTPLIGGNFFTNEVIINGKLAITEKLTATDSGDTDMKAYIYGSIMDNGGFSTSGAQSEGFSVTKTATGTYEVTFTNSPGNKLYTVMANMRFGHIGFISVANASTQFVITTYNTSGALANRAFNFVVYKQ